MSLNKKINHAKFKRILGSHMTISRYRQMSRQIDETYQDEDDKLKISNLPTDVAKLALANKCDITEYEDFHSEKKLNKIQNAYFNALQKLKNIL